MARILLAEDEVVIRAELRRLLNGSGHEVVEVGSVPEALAVLAGGPPDLLITDVRLPGAPGTQLIEAAGGAPVLVMTSYATVRSAVDAMKLGAAEYVSKPFDLDEFLAIVERLLAGGRRSAPPAAAANSGSEPVGKLIGQSPAMSEVFAQIRKVAPSDTTVLVLGESGTGKELVARHIHAKSPRARGPFVAVNCGALSPALLESTLFGHKRGAFTGAVSDEPGLFVAANRGTLFLDELGDLELALQVKLLRALESGEVLPVGSTKPVSVDVRIVSATHKPLAEMVAAKTFRDDLYWRVRGIEVALPRLADRTGDLALLAQHFLNQARSLVPSAGRPRLSAGALRRLEAHAFPGNLRELRHEMQRAVVMAGGREEILEDDLSPSLHGRATPAASPDAEGATLDEKVAALERREIARALAEAGGNRSHAAKRLGLSRQGLLNKIARYGLD